MMKAYITVIACYIISLLVSWCLFDIGVFHYCLALVIAIATGTQMILDKISGNGK